MTQRLAHVLGYLALTLLLTAGAAQSLSGSNTVTSDDIVDGQVAYADIRDNAVSGKKILDGSVTAADIANLSWKALPLDNCGLLCQNAPFGDGYAPPRYARDVEGMVHLDGVVSLSDTTLDDDIPAPEYNDVIGALPDGFRPAAKERIAVLCGGTEGATMRMEIDTAGTITVKFSEGCTASNNTWVTLTGVSFPAA